MALTPEYSKCVSFQHCLERRKYQSIQINHMTSVRFVLLEEGGGGSHITVLDCTSIGQAIDPTPEAWFITTWANGMNFITNHALGAGSIA